MMSWIALVVAAFIIVALIVLYNRLVRSRQMVEEGWSGIDVQLKRRADLVPSLVSTVKGYAAHENQVLERVAALRTQAATLPEGDVSGRGRIEGRLSVAIGRLMALAEEQHLTAGLNRRTTDPLHAYEEGVNHEALLAWWNYGDPVCLERCLVAARSTEASRS